MRKQGINRVLIDAVLMNDIGRMRELLAAGANPDSRDAEHGETALMLTRSEMAARILVDVGAEVNACDDRGWTSLMTTNWAFLLRSGADPNAADRYGETALIRAVRSADSDKVKWLIAGGADVSAKDSDGRSALDVANYYGMRWLADWLREAGISK